MLNNKFRPFTDSIIHLCQQLARQPLLAPTLPCSGLQGAPFTPPGGNFLGSEKASPMTSLSGPSIELIRVQHFVDEKLFSFHDYFYS